jgi:hypothetical protein
VANIFKIHESKGGDSVVMVGEWKAKEGIQSYTITGSYDEIYRIIDEVRQEGGKFADTPNICRVHAGQWHVLLKLKVAAEVGLHDKNKGC